jgi:hypothetical protein
MGFYVEDNDDNVFMLKMRLQLLGDFEVEHSIGHIKRRWMPSPRRCRP